MNLSDRLIDIMKLDRLFPRHTLIPSRITLTSPGRARLASDSKSQKAYMTCYPGSEDSSRRRESEWHNS